MFLQKYFMFHLLFHFVAKTTFTHAANFYASSLMNRAINIYKKFKQHV